MAEKTRYSDAELEEFRAIILEKLEKAKKDFGYIPQYSDFKLMMKDYKKDLDENKYQELFKYVK